MGVCGEMQDRLASDAGTCLAASGVRVDTVRTEIRLELRAHYDPEVVQRIAESW